MARDKVKPTHYPFIPFHLLRSAQLVSALIVASIMLYFLWHLTHDHYRLPWTFILLLAVSLLTILSLSTTIVLHCCCGLNPRLNVCLNGCLLVLWSVGFALLSWWSSGTLSHVCNRSNWENETGIMVCRVYKALFAFTLLGFVSTFAAALLDIFVFRRLPPAENTTKCKTSMKRGVLIPLTLFLALIHYRMRRKNLLALSQHIHQGRWDIQSQKDSSATIRDIRALMKQEGRRLKKQQPE